MIYFARSGMEGPIKIGSSRNPRQRVTDLAGAHHDEITLMAVAPGDSTDEFALHKRFADDRIRREWFRPSEALLAYIKQVGRPLEGMRCNPFPAVPEHVEKTELGASDPDPIIDPVSLSDFSLHQRAIWRWRPDKDPLCEGDGDWEPATPTQCAIYVSLALDAMITACADVIEAYNGCPSGSGCRVAIADMLRARSARTVHSLARTARDIRDAGVVEGERKLRAALTEDDARRAYTIAVTFAVRKARYAHPDTEHEKQLAVAKLEAAREFLDLMGLVELAKIDAFLEELPIQERLL